MDHIISADKAWVKDLEYVFKYGNRVSPRGMLCFEAISLTSVVSMQNPIIYNPIRKLGYKFMAAEAAWILEGRNDVASISKYSKDIAKFSDDGVTFYGAYGPRLKDQWDYVETTLKADLHSRQAVATVWRQNPQPTKDVPCTVALQWLIRHNVLHCVATMRSSDLWLGHPYDIFNFSAYSFALMLQLNNHLEQYDQPTLTLGNLHLTAGSKHIYERNAADVGRIIEDYSDNGVPKAKRGTIFNVQHYDDANEFIQILWDAANSERGILSLEE